LAEELTLDGLTFVIRRSPRRKMMGITIEGDGTLLLQSPLDQSISSLETFARQKLVWVHTKLMEKSALRPAYQRVFINGEGFYYLGRSYRLWVDDDPNTPKLRLHAGRFWLRRDELPNARFCFVDWYRTHGLTWLYNRAITFTARIGADMQRFDVRDLGQQWGICEPDGMIALHWRVVMLPPPIIDYVIVHELTHLREPHHKPAFWVRLGRILPDYAERKRWLGEHGAEFDI